jgi:hypothetical protein
MNLGNFAGGLAQGLATGSRIKLAKQEQEDTRNFRERTAKMAEEKHGWEQQDRESEQALRAEYDTMFKQFYPEGKAFGQDAATDMKFTAATYGMSLKRGKINPKELLEYGKQIKEMEQSELGQKFMKALNGGQGSTEFQELAGQYGLNGQAAKFDPKAMVLTDGKSSIDVRMPMMMLGLKEPLSMLESIRKGDQDAEMHTSNLRKNDAQTGAYGASAAASSASAEQTKVETGNLRAGLPKNPAASRVDSEKALGSALSGSDSFKMLQSRDRLAIIEAGKLFIQRGDGPLVAAAKAQAAYETAMMKSKELGRPPAQILQEAIASSGQK